MWAVPVGWLKWGQAAVGCYLAFLCCLLKNVSVLTLFISTKYLIHCLLRAGAQIFFFSPPFYLQMDLFVVVKCVRAAKASESYFCPDHVVVSHNSVQIHLL